MTKKSNESIVFIAGLLFSVFMVIAFPRFYFEKDLPVFWEWAQFWKTNWKDIYISCKSCNYPILGIFSSAGLLSALEGFGQEKAFFLYRLLLAVVDGINVLLIYWIFKRLSVEKAAFWAGVIGVSISSWAGGALWAQIDGISQFFLLLSLAWMIRANTGDLLHGNGFRWYLIVSGFLLGFVLLTKQLTIFSAAPLGLLLAANILFRARKWKQIFLDAALASGSFLVSIFAMDLFLNLKEPYISHLYYIWKEDSFYRGIIAGNGFNIWIFLGRDMWSSSNIPFFSNLNGLTPYSVGMVLFLFLAGVITLSLLLFLKKRCGQDERFLKPELLLNFIFYLALLNLSFNVLLTGTHERYLYHFYPYILIAVVGLAEYNHVFSQKLLATLVLGASLYGVFILMIISPYDFRIGYLAHWLLGMFHLALFIWLVSIILKYQNFSGNLGAIFRKDTKNLPTVR